MDHILFDIHTQKGAHIFLCKIQEKDAWAICDFAVANESRLKSFFPKTLAQNLTPDLSKAFTQLKYKEFQNKEEYLFTLKEAKSRRIIGLYYIKELHKVEHQGELAYCIDYNFEGQGITSNIVKRLTEYAFEFLDLNRLQILVHKSNKASVKVAENCGFTWQKTLYKSYKPSGQEALDMELYENYK